MCASLGLGQFITSRGGEVTYSALRIGDETYTNVTVLSANPSEVLLRVPGGFKKLSRAELPEALAARYPYDPAAAAAWEREQIEKDRMQKERERETIYQALARKEQRAAARLEKTRQSLNDLDQILRIQINKARGTGKNSPEHLEANRTRDQKLSLTRQTQALQRELEGLRQQMAGYR